jgi:hypothetical protein
MIIAALLTGGRHKKTENRSFPLVLGEGRGSFPTPPPRESKQYPQKNKKLKANSIEPPPQDVGFGFSEPKAKPE